MRPALAAAVLCALAGVARAEAPREIADANAAASAGDWARVLQLVTPVLARQVAQADRAELERLAGLASYFQNDRDGAEAHYVAFLRIDPDGSLDPALYPPEAVAFLEGVKTRHRADIQAHRPHARRLWIIAPVPVASQFQNGERAKGYVIGGLAAGFLVGNLVTFAILDSWCSQTSGTKTGVTCDDTSNHFHAANDLRTANLVFGLAAITTLAYGVYDGVTHYRARSRELSVQPFATASANAGVVGIAGSF